MKQLEKRFSKTERIVAKAKFTCWVFLREIFVALLLGAIIAVLWVYMPQVNSLLKKEILTEQIMKYVLLGAGGFVLVMTMFEALIHRCKEALITDKKFALRMGVLSVVEEQLPIDQIRSVESAQNFIQRILHYGNVTLITDAIKPIVLKGIIRPERFAERVTKQKARTKNIEDKKLYRLELSPTVRKPHII